MYGFAGGHGIIRADRRCLHIFYNIPAKIKEHCSCTKHHTITATVEHVTPVEMQTPSTDVYFVKLIFSGEVVGST